MYAKDVCNGKTKREALGPDGSSEDSKEAR
jgi:hypothetical protein